MQLHYHGLPCGAFPKQEQIRVKVDWRFVLNGNRYFEVCRTMRLVHVAALSQSVLSNIEPIILCELQLQQLWDFTSPTIMNEGAWEQKHVKYILLGWSALKWTCYFPCIYKAQIQEICAHAVCINCLFDPGQGSPNYLNKGPVSFPSEFRGTGLWPVRIETVLSPVGVNCAVMPRHWLSFLCPSLGPRCIFSPFKKKKVRNGLKKLQFVFRNHVGKPILWHLDEQNHVVVYLVDGSLPGTALLIHNKTHTSFQSPNRVHFRDHWWFWGSVHTRALGNAPILPTISKCDVNVAHLRVQVPFIAT